MSQILPPYFGPVKYITAKISASLFGHDCALCAGRSATSLVCPACIEALPRIARACPRCAIPLGTRGPYCGECLAPDRHAFDDALAVFEYRFPIDRLVQRFKYAGDLALGSWLASRLAESAALRPRPDLIVAAPLSARGLRRRGFNQALVIARRVAGALRLRCDFDALRKVRETAPQQRLERRQRIRNLQDAFECRVRLAGEHVAIVDDVITTGATMDALARALRECGAGRVSAWAVARTPDPAIR